MNELALNVSLLMEDTIFFSLKNVLFTFFLFLSLLLFQPSTYCLAASIDIEPSGDAYVSSDAPNMNFGNDSLLGIGTYQDILSCVKFNLGSIPYNSTIQQATLKLFCTSTSSNGMVSIARVTEPWSEDGVTWSNRPGWTTPLISSTPGGSNQWWEINVTEIVEEWINIGSINNGFYMEKQENGLVLVNSSESANSPELSISYTAPNVCPTLNMTAPANNISVRQGENVTISWDGTDPDDSASVHLYYDEDQAVDNGNDVNILIFAKVDIH